MARAFSMKDAAERLEKFPAMLAHEGEAPVAAILRRGQPVLAVLPWDLYIALLQGLADMPEEAASAQREGIRTLLADATGTLTAEAPAAGSQKATSSRRPAHRRHPSQ